MSKIDIEALMVPVSDDSPCGEDLEYDPAFSEMERAAAGREEQEIGDIVVEAEEPDWVDLRDKALAVLGDSKDLRAGVYLTTALLKTDGLPGFAQGLELIARLVEEQWHGVHPVLDPDDDMDPTIRVNTIAQLADPAGILQHLRQSPLTESRMMGRFSMRDVMLARGEMALPEGSDATPPDMASINGAFQDTDGEILQGFADAVEGSMASVSSLTTNITDRVGAADTVDLSALTKLLNDVKKVLAGFLGGEAAAEEGASDGIAGAAPVAAAGAVAAMPGVISNANEVLNALDRICDYYKRQEPSSPVPVLLQRARRLVSADFLTIVKDLAPDGVEQVNLVGGIKEEPEHEY